MSSGVNILAHIRSQHWLGLNPSTTTISPFSDRPRPVLASGAQVARAAEPVIHVYLQAPLPASDAPGIGELAGCQTTMNLDLF